MRSKIKNLFTNAKFESGELSRVVRSEFKSQLTLGQIAVPLLLALFALITPLASPNIVESMTDTLTKGPIAPTQAQIDAAVLARTTALFSQVFGQGATYALFYRAYSVWNDKSTIDKNRTTYLHFCERKVLFSKFFSDLILFSITFLTTALVAISIVLGLKDGAIESGFVSKFVAYYFGLIFFYALTSIGIRLITSRIRDRKKMFITLGFWVFLTVVYYIAISITQGVVEVNNEKVVANFFIENGNWLSFIPILNIGYISLSFLDGAKSWWVVPLIVETLIFFIIIWTPLSRWFKEYLCA